MKITKYRKCVSHRALLLGAAMMVVGASLQAQELVRNGTFMNNHIGWEFKIYDGYLKDAPRPKIDARAEGVLISGLFADHHHPANAVALIQRVVIENGRRYRLSFEVKGDGGEGRYGRINYIVHAPFWGASWSLLNSRQSHISNQLEVTGEWQKVDVEFTGKFGPNDFNEMKQTMRDGIKNHVEWDSARKKRETDMIHWSVNFTNLELWFAKGRGDIRVRNVSLQPVP
ncbi:MAG TPA: hypothetical protein PKE26_09630 [Kiritimatiellia bacterium]|nr:hypothetical protein [Kiritimatiellia bacterium]HMO99356.1 hypothetical protein [Kiritimatiellia bacterium]HMP95656.1 hypothetical protein [Kiritimatiellia bacterium]